MGIPFRGLEGNLREVEDREKVDKVIFKRDGKGEYFKIGQSSLRFNGYERETPSSMGLPLLHRRKERPLADDSWMAV